MYERIYIMSLKNLISLSLCAGLCVSVLAGCGNGNSTSTASAEVRSTEAAASSEAAGTAESLENASEAAKSSQAALADGGITIEYPATMQEKGYTEALHLDAAPQKVAVLSSSPVMALYELGIHMIAVPSSSVVEWPKDLTDHAKLLNISMNDNFDIETVIALEPDFAIVGYTSADTYGQILEDAGIPVYYVDAGHTVPYGSIKEQTQALADAFASSEEAKTELMSCFTDLEARIDELKADFAGKTCMVLQSAPPTHYIQTSDGTLGSMMEMLGFENVYTNDAASMAEMDLEQAINYDPDIIVCVGSSKTGEEHQQLMEEDFAKNPSYWESIPAIANGDIIYLPSTYISSPGILITDTINELADILETHFNGEASGESETAA